jgi:hypothetical protein
MHVSPFSVFVLFSASLLTTWGCAQPASAPAAPSQGPLKFEMHRVGSFRSESVGVGDFNGDGKLDIAAGPYIYLAPDWKARKFRTPGGSVDDKGIGYWWDFMSAPLDVDGDGLLDVVSCSWHAMQSEWYLNTGTAGGEWPVTVIDKNGNFECGDIYDIDGDGKAQEVYPHVQTTVWYELGAGPDGKRTMVKRVVSEKPMSYGGGVGDVNGDKRPDILRPEAWFEGPEDPRKGTWKEHPLAVGHKQEGKSDHTPQILVYDVNADGLNDIVTSSAHGYGIFWYEQRKGTPHPAWKQHLIDASWTQAHSLTLADLDGDGDLDLATGKRFMAHNGSDPEETMETPIGVYWYELRRGESPLWAKHVISFGKSGEGVGSGMSIPVVDLDKDGDLDIVVTGKWGGPVWFENKGK